MGFQSDPLVHFEDVAGACTEMAGVAKGSLNHAGMKLLVGGCEVYLQRKLGL